MTTQAARKNRLDSLVRSCKLLQRTCVSRPGAKKSDALYYGLLATYFSRLTTAREEGRPIALHTVFLPAELLYAMDIVPLHGETTTWTTAIFTRQSAELLSAAAELRLASEICSAHRGLAGAYATGMLPRPDMVLWSSLMCDNTAKSGELLMEMNHCPGFFVDHPFQETPYEVSYLVRELESLVAFLEERTGKKLDRDRLAEIMAGTSRQIELSREINELRKHIPSPFPPQRFLELLTTHYLFPGQPEAIEYLETLRGELVEMVKAGKGAVPEERFRLMSLWVPPLHALTFLGRISEEYGAVSVVEPLFDLWRAGNLAGGDPLEALARKSFMFPEMCAYGPLDHRTLKATVDSAREYKADGAIFYAHIGCRGACATLKPLKDALDRVDLPMLTLDCDIVDATVTSEYDMRGKMEQFFELLQERR